MQAGVYGVGSLRALAKKMRQTVQSVRSEMLGATNNDKFAGPL